MNEPESCWVFELEVDVGATELAQKRRVLEWRLSNVGPDRRFRGLNFRYDLRVTHARYSIMWGLYKKEADDVSNAILNVPEPKNEPVYSYAPGTPERQTLQAQIKDMLGNEIEIPIIVGGKEIRTGDLGDCVCPHDHGHVLGRYHKATTEVVEQAAQARRRCVARLVGDGLACAR